MDKVVFCLISLIAAAFMFTAFVLHVRAKINDDAKASWKIENLIIVCSVACSVFAIVLLPDNTKIPIVSIVCLVCLLASAGLTVLKDAIINPNHKIVFFMLAVIVYCSSLFFFTYSVLEFIPS